MVYGKLNKPVNSERSYFYSSALEANLNNTYNSKLFFE
ncbi:hypothetical protein C8N37_106434 [Sphingobacterium faecium]|nr:hypothetical protein C8N37_106434 [Sphingobacterium faecium]